MSEEVKEKLIKSIIEMSNGVNKVELDEKTKNITEYTDIIKTLKGDIKD